MAAPKNSSTYATAFRMCLNNAGIWVEEQDIGKLIGDSSKVPWAQYAHSPAQMTTIYQHLLSMLGKICAHEGWAVDSAKLNAGCPSDRNSLIKDYYRTIFVDALEHPVSTAAAMSVAIPLSPISGTYLAGFQEGLAAAAGIAQRTQRIKARKKRKGAKR